MPHLEPLLALLALDRLPRTGWVQRGVPEPESIAGHVLGTAHLALALAPEVLPPLDLQRVLAMALVHDAPEALTGDLPKAASELLPAGAKQAMESAAAERLLVPLGPAAAEAFREFQAQETREARFARLCDKLQLGVRLVGYRRSGQRGLEEFSVGLRTLDAAEFAPLAAFQQELLAELDG